MENNMLNNENFGTLNAKYEQGLETGGTDFGSITLTEKISGRSFILDVVNYHKYYDTNEVECNLDDIQTVIEEETFIGEEYDLKEEDLLLDTLEVVFYTGDETDGLIPTSAYLIAYVNGKEIKIKAKPEYEE
jgi:hypothetical protein